MTADYTYALMHKQFNLGTCFASDFTAKKIILLQNVAYFTNLCIKENLCLSVEKMHLGMHNNRVKNSAIEHKKACYHVGFAMRNQPMHNQHGMDRDNIAGKTHFELGYLGKFISSLNPNANITFHCKILQNWVLKQLVLQDFCSKINKFNSINLINLLKRSPQQDYCRGLKEISRSFSILVKRFIKTLNGFWPIKSYAFI